MTSVTLRHPVVVLVAALAAAVAAGLFGGDVAAHTTPFGFDDPASEAVRAGNALQDATGADPLPGVVALVAPPTPQRVERVARALRANPGVAAVLTYYDTRDRSLLSRDGHSTIVVAYLRRFEDRAQGAAARSVEDAIRGIPGVTVGGSRVAYAEISSAVADDLRRAEIVAFPLLFLLAFVVFRGLVAALLPPLVGALAIVLTFLGLRLASEVTDISVFSVNLVTGLGLGLAIDWSLLVISRFREELEHGDARAATLRTLQTAGRTVVFSALTVASAMASLLVFPQSFLFSMGIGGVLVSLLGGVVSLVVLPAALLLLGPRVNALAPARWQRAGNGERGHWYRFSRLVMRRPVTIAAVSGAFLVLLGTPFHRIDFVFADARVLPADTDARRVDDAVRRDFPPSRTNPIYLSVNSPRPRAVAELAADIAKLPGVDAVSPPQQAGTGYRLDVFPRQDFLAPETQLLVERIRALPKAHHALTGGLAPWFHDQKASMRAHLPYALAIVSLATLILLFLMTGSVVLPLKALVMNLLTVSVAFGAIVWIFQDGRFESLLHYESRGGLDFSQPILLFAVVFGLSTDYGVFLLTRIREERLRGADDTEAVARGLERTGRVVTAAALLLCVAVGAFATSRVVFVKELGVGIAVGVLVDATLVRALLVPSLMKLLGRWNWWAPGPLRRLHERLGLED
jgi:uncharacterized membrane protein YdfJ with MMPL/SSD domain